MAKRARRWFPNQHSCHATSKKCKKDTKSVPISGRCCWSGRAGSGRVGSGRVGPGRANRAFEDPNWSTQNGRLLWGSVLKNVREIAAEPVPVTLGEFRRSLRSLCFLPRRFAPRGASRRFANLIIAAYMYSDITPRHTMDGIGPLRSIDEKRSLWSCEWLNRFSFFVQ